MSNLGTMQSCGSIDIYIRYVILTSWEMAHNNYYLTKAETEIYVEYVSWLKKYYGNGSLEYDICVYVYNLGAL